MATRDPKTPFLGAITPGELEVDNPDGTVGAFGLGPYAVGNPKGRQFSQGAGTPKEIGNAGGRGKTLTVK